MISDPQVSITYWIGKNRQYFAAPIINGKTDFNQRTPIKRDDIKNEDIFADLYEISFIKDDTDFDLKYLEKIRRKKTRRKKS